jgi:hypothetical protein
MKEEDSMRKTVFFGVILCACLGAYALIPATSSATDKDCPGCPKSGDWATPAGAGPAATEAPPAPAIMLDPMWQKFVAPPLAPGELPDCHRVQFGKKDCIECHKKETPRAYQEWLGSKHGINSVKCGICHGDANNYRGRPDKVVCIGCHSDQVKNMPAQALVTNCSFCHKGHWFTVHKIAQYERFSPGRAGRFKIPGFE